MKNIIKIFAGYFLVFCLFPVFAHGASVSFTWQAGQEADLGGYRLYYGLSSRDYGPPVQVGKATEYTLTGLEEGKTYYFAITAVDNSGNESGFSNELLKTFPTSEMPAGTTEVALWWTEWPSRNPAVPVEIYDGDTLLKTVEVNQQTNGGQWNVLGVFKFDSSIRVEIVSLDDRYSTSADAVRLLSAEGVTRIIDNGSAETSFTGTWLASGAQSYFGSDSLYSKTPNGRYRFETSAAPPVADTEIALWWTPWQSRSQGVPVNIYDGDTKVDTLLVNQQENGGKWNVIGKYAFSKLIKVEIISETSEFSTSADAVRIEKNGNIIIIDNGDTGTSFTGEWAVSGADSYFGENSLWSRAPGASYVFETKILPDDKSAPVVKILSPAEAELLEFDKSEMDISGSAEDNVGVSAVIWENDRGGSGSAAGTESWTVTGAPLFEGRNIIKVTASDKAGNTGSASLTVNYILPDEAPPVVYITSPVSGEKYETESDTVTVAGNASDNRDIASVTWINSRGGSGTASGTESWTVSGLKLSEGDNILTFSAVDSAGNEGSTTLTVTYTPPDIVKPVLTITSHTAGETFETGETPISITGTASDNTGLSLVSWENSRGGKGSATGTSSWDTGDIGLFDGENVITVTVVDSAGNVSTGEIVVVYNEPESAVSLWWTEWPSRNPAVPVNIYDGNSLIDTVSINQTENGGKWNQVGRYDFKGVPRVEIVCNSSDYSTNADAVKLEYRDGSVLIINNGDAGTSSTGSWRDSGGSGAYEGGSLWSRQSGATYTFSPERTEVSLWWTEWRSRSERVPVEIYDGDELIDTVYVNQQNNGGKWNVLGSYLIKNDTVTVVIKSDNQGYSVCADGMRLITGSNEPRYVDNGDSDTSMTGNWYPSGGSGYFRSQSVYTREPDASYSFKSVR